MNFICQPCRDAADIKAVKGSMLLIVKANTHAKCKGSTWCDCQHRVKKV